MAGKKKDAKQRASDHAFGGAGGAGGAVERHATLVNRRAGDVAQRVTGAQVFFAPDADGPVPVDPGKMMAEVRQEAERMTDPQTRAYLLAFADRGYMVIEEGLC